MSVVSRETLSYPISIVRARPLHTLIIKSIGIWLRDPFSMRSLKIANAQAVLIHRARCCSPSEDCSSASKARAWFRSTESYPSVNRW